MVFEFLTDYLVKKTSNLKDLSCCYRHEASPILKEMRVGEGAKYRTASKSSILQGQGIALAWHKEVGGSNGHFGLTKAKTVCRPIDGSVI